MSGAGKKVADEVFKAGKAIDWDGMSKLLVSDFARKEFAVLRRTFDEVNNTLQSKFSQVNFSFSIFIFESILFFCLFGPDLCCYVLRVLLDLKM